MIIKILNIIGLLLGMIGSFLMFINTPKISFRTIVYQKAERPIIEAKEKLMNQKLRAGMILLFIGFLLQLIALFM